MQGQCRSEVRGLTGRVAEFTARHQERRAVGDELDGRSLPAQVRRDHLQSSASFGSTDSRAGTGGRPFSARTCVKSVAPCGKATSGRFA